MRTAPRMFCERRTEHINLVDTHHYAVRVTQQFTVPDHGSAPARPVLRDLLIPLGELAKDRVPDLCVTGPAGELLPVLSRATRGEVVSTLYTSRWQSCIFQPQDDETLPNHARAQARVKWDILQISIAHIVTSGATVAAELVAQLERYLEECADDSTLGVVLAARYGDLHRDPEFWAGVRALAASRLLIARLRGTPGQSYVANIAYAEHFRDSGHGSSHIRGLLARLGLIPIPISRQAANCDQAASFWAIITTPPDVNIVRIFWQSDRDTVPDDDSVSIAPHRAVAGRYQWSGDEPEENELLLDVQMAPSPSVLTTLVLAAILLYVSRYVYQGFPRPGASEEQRTVLVGLGSLFVAVPATIAGATAYRSPAFSRYASRGPRVMTGILSGLAVFLAVAVSLKGITTLAEDSAYVLSVYCVFVIGIFGYIQVGPRWTTTDGTGWPKRARTATPDVCRKRQTWAAVGFFAIWILLVIVFARCQIVLQHRHFFTDFPREPWNAWWSLFGL